ncbi:hypothetical protein [Nocardia lasii]|uniref:Secreted protein n=1 Tax=Nocardia lasii TaxID=1616107 RepID=A0ABW1JTY5_9NOCA
MNGIRRGHRWCGVAFLAAVVITSVSLAVGGPAWVVYLPLIPLAGLVLSGIVMFVGVYRSASGPRTRPVPRVHRWSAVLLVLGVLVTMVSFAVGGPEWVAYVPLLPLAGVAVSGVVMLVSPGRRAVAGARG